ncbi:hypothetical protein DVA86_15375 [Streptomyces armeniacus]|uniref:Uncharacterized protein n=1 Tax=Streptomyces armeniacus TaxID=83291 RepID=A0A345XQB8_9ACTN|nr:hypothetical protein DVA86_15375 [Streptomyces armeniacus]
MASNESGDAPIYDNLIGEQGDVLAEARQAAEEAQRVGTNVLPINERGRRKPDTGAFPDHPQSNSPAPNSAPHSSAPHSSARNSPVPDSPAPDQNTGAEPNPQPHPASSPPGGFDQPWSH